MQTLDHQRCLTARWRLFYACGCESSWQWFTNDPFSALDSGTFLGIGPHL